MHARRGPILQRLMRTNLVVKLKVRRRPRRQLGHRRIPLRIQLFVLHTPPKPLHEDIIVATPHPIHAHPNPRRLQSTRPRRRRELHPLIRIENLGLAPRQRLLQHRQTETLSIVQRSKLDNILNSGVAKNRKAKILHSRLKYDAQ